MLRIAIQPEKQYLMSGRYQSFSDRWVELANRGGHDVRLVDVFHPDFFRQLEGCDGFMWWFAHLPMPRNYGKRLIPAIAHGLDMPTFPNTQTIWHFDDKIAQKYLLDAAGVPQPTTWVFWSQQRALDFCRTATYPMVIKLASGIVSENVRLLRDYDDAEYWVRQLFGAGIVALERGSALSPKDLYRRLRGAAKILVKGSPPNLGVRTDLQKGYALFQEFVAGNEFDTRITIIGNRAFGFRRLNRPGDFRASGSGRIEFDPSKIDPAAVRLAFRVARKLGTQSLAVDVLYRDGRPVFTEISYYYEGWALAECPGHWRLDGDLEAGELEWVEGHLAPEDAIFEDFIALLDERAARPDAKRSDHGVFAEWPSDDSAKTTRRATDGRQKTAAGAGDR